MEGTVLTCGHATNDLRQNCATCLVWFNLLEKKRALDDWEMQIDIRQAMVEFREQLLQADLPPFRATCLRVAKEAAAKWREAITAVEDAQAAGCSEALAEARRCLEGPCTKSAVLALRAVVERFGERPDAAEKAVARAVRDLLVMRCRIQAPSGDQKAFIEVVEEALGGKLDNQQRSLILLSYHKTSRGTADTFSSTSQLRRRSQPRGPRGARGAAPVDPAPEDGSEGSGNDQDVHG